VKKIDRYIISEILSPLLIVTIVFSGLFICFSSARLLADAISESIGFNLIIKLIMLKTLIAQDVLLPIALYAAIIFALGRLHRNQEIIVMAAAGISEASIIWIVLRAVLPVVLIIGIFSIMVRPWAYTHVYLTDAYIYGDTNFDKYQAGRFYGNEDNGRVIYLKNKNSETGDMDAVFLYTHGDKASELILSKSGKQVKMKDSDLTELQLYDGYMYRINHEGEQDSIIRFSKFVYMPNSDNSIGYKRKMEDIYALLHSTDPGDIAELQWRFSRPIAAIILALLAIPLSRTSPRQGRSENVFIAAIVFAIYYNLTGLVQSWVEQGVIGEYPGVWWLHALMFLTVLWFLIPDFVKKSGLSK